jgi:hypothetical protein
MPECYVIPKGFKIISGGQTGADQAGLDWAIEHGVVHGGRCPKGRKSEDGLIDARYNLIETAESNYLVRTKLNVQQSDATLIFTLAKELDGGSKKTREFAEKFGMPSRHIHPGTNPEHVVGFLTRNRVKILNVAGKRESSAPGISSWVKEYLDQVLVVPD